MKTIHRERLKKKKKAQIFAGPYRKLASQMAQGVKNPAVKTGDTRDVGSIPGSGRTMK